MSREYMEAYAEHEIDCAPAVNEIVDEEIRGWNEYNKITRNILGEKNITYYLPKNPDKLLLRAARIATLFKQSSKIFDNLQQLLMMPHYDFSSIRYTIITEQTYITHDHYVKYHFDVERYLRNLDIIRKCKECQHKTSFGVEISITTCPKHSSSTKIYHSPPSLNELIHAKKPIELKIITDDEWHILVYEQILELEGNEQMYMV